MTYRNWVTGLALVCCIYIACSALLVQVQLWEISLSTLLLAVTMALLVASLATSGSFRSALSMGSLFIMLSALVVSLWTQGLSPSETGLIAYFTLATFIGFQLMPHSEHNSDHLSLEHFFIAASIYSALLALAHIVMSTPPTRTLLMTAPLSVLIFVATLRNSQKPFQRSSSWICLWLILIVSTLTLSRLSTFLILALMLTGLLFVPISIRVRTAHAVTSTFFVALTFMLHPAGLDRLFGRDSTLKVGPLVLNGEGRSAVQQVVIQQFPDVDTKQWLLGNGPGSVTGQLRANGFYLTDLHNEWLALFSEGGILAVLVTLVAFGVVLRRSWRAARSHRGFEAYVGSAVIITLALSMIFTNTLSFAWYVVPAGLIARFPFKDKSSGKKNGRL